jgi:hypothetical protein
MRSQRAGQTDRSANYPISNTQKAVNDLKAAFPRTFGPALDRVIAARVGDVSLMPVAVQIRSLIDVADGLKRSFALTERQSHAVSAARGEWMAELMNMFGQKGGRDYEAGRSRVDVSIGESSFERVKDSAITRLKGWGIPVPFKTENDKASEQYTADRMKWQATTFALVAESFPMLRVASA